MEKNDKIAIKMSVFYEFTRTLPSGILSLYYLSKGVSYADVSLIKIFQQIFWLLFEIPAGYIADRFGRMKTQVFAALVMGLAFFLYYFASDLKSLIIAESIYGIAFAFSTGNILSWYMDLQVNKANNFFPKLMSTTAIYSWIAGMIGIYIFNNDKNLIFLIGMFLFIMYSLWVSMLMYKDVIVDNKKMSREEVNFKFLKDKKIIYVMLLSVGFAFCSQIIYNYWSILFVEYYSFNFYLTYTIIFLTGFCYQFIDSRLNISQINKYFYVNALVFVPLIIMGMSEYRMLNIILLAISQLFRTGFFALISNYQNIYISDYEDKTFIKSFISGLSGITSIVAMIICVKFITDIQNISLLITVFSTVGLGSSFYLMKKIG